MALVNRSLKFKKGDEVPLMDDKTIQDDNDVNFAGGSRNDDDDSDDEMMQEKPFKQHSITLWLSDAIVLVIDHLQYYAILLSLSERWGWPIDWVKATAFTFIFNFDIWEFRKVETGVFDHSRVSFITSSEMGFNYVSYLSAWAVILCIIAGIFGGVYFRWMKKRPLYLLMYIARWKRLMFLVLQFLCIPFGVAAARIFHCRKDVASKNDVMDVQNEYKCFDATHIGFMTLVSLLFLLMFMVYPFIISRWIKDQVFSNDAGRHEGYLQLKEAEYEQGLDILWDIGQYHLFSSFRRFWVYYNPLKFLFKFFAIVCFAFSVHSTFWSSACLTILFVLATFILIVKRPYRVRCFNVMIICSHFIISADALIGNFMVRPPWEDPDSFQIVSFLRYPTILRILVAINLTWLCILFLWIIYMVMLNNGLINKERIWPRLSYDSSNTIGEDTKKYLKAALKARLTLEHSVSAIPLFAPIHELSHQIKVINAYCREAEYIGDPTHDTLWDLLDELIEAHNALVPISVFGMSGKNSIRETSEEFIKLMPSFKKRLKQREYDYILMTPIKRRLLLKMYVLSIFINSKRKRLSSEQGVASKLQEALLTFEGKAIEDFDFDSSPPSTASASTRPLSTQTSEQSRSDSGMTGFLRDVDAFTSMHPAGNRKTSLSSGNSNSRPSSKSGKEEKLSSRRSSSSSVSLIKPSQNQVSPTPFSDDVEANRPNSAPLSPKHQVHPGRNSTPLSPIPQGIALRTFKTNELPQKTLQTWTEFPVTIDKDRISAPFEGAIQTLSKETSHAYTSRPGSAPQPRVKQSHTASSRPNTAPYQGRKRLPYTTEPNSMFPSPSSHRSSLANTPTKEMSSTASLPGQIEEELNEEVRRSSTVLH